MISGVTAPEVVAFPAESPNGTGILVIPGGGYERIALDREGADVAAELNPRGYTVFVMSYRMPGEGHADTPLADARQAMRLIRSMAGQYQLTRLGVMGFSAGGHIAASLGTRANHDEHSAEHAAEPSDVRPDFMALMYPVISMDKEIAHPGCRNKLIGPEPDDTAIRQYSVEKQVNRDTPACFMMHAANDRSVLPANSFVMWQALKMNDIAVELHLFQKGGHGFGVRGAKGLPAEVWPSLLDRWLNTACRSSEFISHN